MADISSGISRNAGPGLYEFLMEAELQQYYAGIRGDLKVQTTAQLKYVTEEDLNAIGMSKPEMRRLKKYFQKYFPQNYLSKFKKMLLSKREEQPSGSLAILPEEKQDKPPIKVPNKHMIPADAIIVNKELGMGEFGVVQQGVWTNDGERIQVAIKCLSRERMQNNPIEFLKEAAIMHAIDHEHIVRLYGVVLDTNSLMLVTELAPLRSLLECLKEPSLRGSFPIISLCDFSIQIADGMQYLEAKRLIHRDLAARNILVFSKNKVKISDFGLSRALGVGKDYYQTNFNVNLKLPIAWCAPECISYLKFTSASDVWAYGVTLWEMFSYGFQPWAALTGHQILEAIDEPNFQRLEQPDCCPKDYFSLMLQCWQHEPGKRPKFSELVNLLPDLKPEQVQAVQDSGEIGQLSYRQGDIISVLDKGSNNILWKGVLPSGKTGLFNPAHTIAYLGSNLPSNKPGEFSRGDGKNAFSSQRRKIRTDMISSPQGDLKHTGHVGLDGAYFGDISFLGGKYPHLPRQVVTPYKPHEDVPDNSSQIVHTESREGNQCREGADGRECRNSETPRNSHVEVKHENIWEGNEMVMGNGGRVKGGKRGTGESLPADHEYHEISDEENQDSPLRFDKPLNFDFGPSLLDEMDQMFRSLGTSPPPPPPGHPGTIDHEASNARNELREIQAKQSSKKKQATWLCTSLQSLSSTVSSIESLGAPSTLKLPLWDKASAEFCFAKSRELLTKPSAWTSYMDVDFDSHFLDNEAVKQHLVKSTEYLENGNRDVPPRLSKNSKNPLDHRNHVPNVNGKSYCSSPNLEIPRDVKRVSASYVDRYFDQSNTPAYYEDENSFNCIERSLEAFGDDQRIENVNNIDENNKSEYWKNYEEISMRREKLLQEKVMNTQEFRDLRTNETETPRSKAKSFDFSEAFSNFDLGTRPKVPGPTKLNIREDVEKRLELQKVRSSGVRPNLESMRVKIQTYRKAEDNKNGHDNFPFLISNNPLFISEPEKQESPVYSSSESLRVNFQRLRRKSDVDANNQEDLSCKIFAEKYQREVSGLESVKNYLDAKKGQRFNLGLGKLTQNMIQLGKNIAQNSRNLDLPRMSNLRTDNQGIRNEGNPSEKGNPREQGNPQMSNDTKPVSMKPQKNLVLDLGQANHRANAPGGGNSSPRQHILEPSKIYQNEVLKKEQMRPEIVIDKVQGTPNVYRHRTSSLSEVRKTTIKGIRRSYHPDNESSEDSDSISHSETDIRGRLKFKRRYRKIPQGFKLNFKNKAAFLNPESARRGMALEVTGKSPPPSTSFLNSLSPPFASRNNLVSWPESAPSSSLTFTSNSELDSDTSSEYPEFTQDTLTFPPSPAP